MNTLIVSDIHLGSVRSNASYLTDLLIKEWGTYKRLILNGDVFDDLSFKRLPKEQWKLMSFIRGKSNDIEIVWIHGNHDEEAMEVLAHMLGVSIVEKYEFVENDISFLVTHGHSFNPFYRVHEWLENFFKWLYTHIERIDGRGRIALWVEKHFKDRTMDYALTHARFMKHDWLICGHSHKPIVQKPYANCGAWVNDLMTYIVVDENGTLKLEHYR